MARTNHVPDFLGPESERASESPVKGNMHASNSNPVQNSDGVSPQPIKDSERNTSEDDQTSVHMMEMDITNRDGESIRAGVEEDSTIIVAVPAPKNPAEFRPYEDDTINSVLEEVIGSDGEVLYRVEFEDERQEKVTFNRLLHLPNGKSALDLFDGTESSESIIVAGNAKKRTRRQPAKNDFVDITNMQLSSDDQHSPVNRKKKPRLSKSMSTVEAGNAHSSRRVVVEDDGSEGSDSELHLAKPRGSRRLGLRTRSTAPKKATTEQSYIEDEDELAGDVEMESEGSDIAYAKPRKTRASKKSTITKSRKRGRSSSFEVFGERPSRVSGRGNKSAKSMKEVDIDEEIFADEVARKATPKAVSIREVYQPVSATSSFGLVHDQVCTVCSGTGSFSNKGTSDLIYCQGCSSSIHKVCLGNRTARKHIVTKVGHQNFVMQCRRCVGPMHDYGPKDPLAPVFGVCSGCNQPGLSCAAFSKKLDAKTEEKIRKENDGDDPVTLVNQDLINNPNNVLFRCRGCHREYHFEHLPPRSKKPVKSQDPELQRAQRIKEYTQDWKCMECSQTRKLQALVAWRPADNKVREKDIDYYEISDNAKEYLVKWDGQSYLRCSWMPGAWIRGITKSSTRKAFVAPDRDANMLPVFTKEDAIPEEYLRMDIIFEVEYDESFKPQSEENDKAQITSVVQVLAKFKGLNYDQAVWEEPPTQDDGERWSDFVSAYDQYLRGKYFKQSPASSMKERIDKFRTLNFQEDIFLKKQPDTMIGGEMMDHQMDGLNWMLYKYHEKKNIILADEMGLGKTIQVISLIATLVNNKPKCWPWLIVTPNSTCPNWRREFQKWAPSLRAVSYYGVKSARDMAMKYELFPDGCSDLRAHVVITSYEAPVDDAGKAFFKRIKWAGMVVDEGHRLKNDGNLLYGALMALGVPFQVLLTGTPVQNNKRELFNLLQFLDRSLNAEALDAKYAELTKENLAQIHDLIRPFFLKRTKVQVLKLPPMSQTIIPVSMSIVQKKLYKSIIEKSPALISLIIGKTNKTLKPGEKSSLNNILVELRKCLCHPFLFSSAIEEKNLSPEALHRNLIDASSKFQLLEIMLPKLQARGHRVLIFSQFLGQLDLLEDFLDGLGLSFRRLDGKTKSVDKQKFIDEFNAPNSKVFAFILSTRAGGVGINLATADTVIILDPDFNPHQDMQALSRAHRIGQTKKVLVFNLVTIASAEEQIVQVGRKKMALDHAIIESMDVDNETENNLEAILKHGARELFLNDDSKDIHYDAASIDELLDRTNVENPDANEDNTVESQFSHAKVWIQDRGLENEFEASDDIAHAEAGWAALLQERLKIAQAADAASNKQLGRLRNRQAVNYNKPQHDLDDPDDSDDPEELPRKHGRRGRKSQSDDEFAGPAAQLSEADDSDADERVDPRELESALPSTKGTKSKKPALSSDRPKSKTIVKGGDEPHLGSAKLSLLYSPKSVPNSEELMQIEEREHTSNFLKTSNPKVLKARTNSLFKECADWQAMTDSTGGIFTSPKQLLQWIERGERLLLTCGNFLEVSEDLEQGQSELARGCKSVRSIATSRLQLPQMIRTEKGREISYDPKEQRSYDSLLLLGEQTNGSLAPSSVEQVNGSVAPSLAERINGSLAPSEANGQSRKRGSNKNHKSASKSLETSEKQDSAQKVSLVRRVRNHLNNVLANPPVRLSTFSDYCQPGFQDHIRDTRARLKKTTKLLDDFDEIFLLERPLNEARDMLDRDYMQRRAAPHNRDVKPIQDQEPDVQALERQLQNLVERELQDALQANQLQWILKYKRLVPGSGPLPDYLQPLPEGTPASIMKDHVRNMAADLASQPRFPPANPIASPSPVNIVPLKRKRGRPSAATQSQEAADITIPSVSMFTNTNANTCPHCNFDIPVLIQTCPCKLAETPIRLMLDTLARSEGDLEQKKKAKKFLRAALASKAAARKQEKK